MITSLLVLPTLHGFCAACAAVAISMLPDALAACEGPYRLRTANHKAGLLSWSHVNDERCEMLHDKSGHAWVAFANPTATDESDAAFGAPRAEYWLLRAAEERIAGSAGDGAKVVCTSAGRTTRLVLGLVESREGIDSRESIGSPRANHDSGDAQSFGLSSDNVRFVSPQDGSIISATHRNIHLRITRDEELRRRGRSESDAPGARLADENENSCGTTLCVKITTNGIEVLTTSLERLTIQGMLQPLHGLEGTNVFELCLFEQDTGDAGDNRLEIKRRQGCIARTTLALEMFSAETQMVQRRSSSETVRTSSVMSSGVVVVVVVVVFCVGYCCRCCCCVCCLRRRLLNVFRTPSPPRCIPPSLFPSAVGSASVFLCSYPPPPRFCGMACSTKTIGWWQRVRVQDQHNQVRPAAAAAFVEDGHVGACDDHRLLPRQAHAVQGKTRPAV